MREGLHKIVSDDETIVAISTPIGHSGLGIVRISGSRCLDVVGRYFTPHSQNRNLQPRVANFGLWSDVNGERIDHVIVTWFRAPQSYTGEDVLEISAHGNPLSLRRIVDCAQQAEVRLATPGEFTLRAVAHGKMDLVQAEAVREFIEAQTEQQAKSALRQLEGALSKRVQPIKDLLVDLIAHLEAGIDFAEDDVDIPSTGWVADRIQPVLDQLNSLKDSFGYGKILSKGLKLTILGKPNVGKSSVFNRILSAERAIVTNIPGTTRDVLTETVSLDGVPLCFADTAGIRETADEVERIGVARTIETVGESDFALVVLDGSRPMDVHDARALELAKRIPHLTVVNKNDLQPMIDVTDFNGEPRVSVSAKTGLGFEDLLANLREFISSRRADSNDDLILTNARHHQAVASAATALAGAASAVVAGVPHEMALLDLYQSLAALNELTGEVVADDILERIFSSFCIGK
jgi:tRNA modification GTPase